MSTSRLRSLHRHSPAQPSPPPCPRHESIYDPHRTATATHPSNSVSHAIAGGVASENLLVICIANEPFFNDYGTNHILQHTIGLFDFLQEIQCLHTDISHHLVLVNLDDMHKLIDMSISTPLRESKLVTDSSFLDILFCDG
ncbi:hypothetical protein BS78_09G144300 [Paspalum vaginatum]|nr:hypothetical protein BS78_09G144300 [Paspalum vaginatum]